MTTFSGFRIKGLAVVRASLVAIMLALGTGCMAQTNVTPARYLFSQPAPYFAPGHHLPPLTRDGYVLDINTAMEFATNWGYALMLGGTTTPSVISLMNTPGTYQHVVAQLARNNPVQYKLAVFRDVTFPTPIPSGFYCTNAAGWFVDKTGTNFWQYITNTAYTPVPCPEGPDGYWQYATAYWISNLMVINSNAPIDMILTDGEYGIGVAGITSPAWFQDPRVRAATNAYKGIDGKSHIYYASAREGHQLGFVTAAIQQQLPNRELNIYYTTGNEQARIAGAPEYAPNMGQGWFTNNNTFGFMSSNCLVTNTDLPSFQDYYPYYRVLGTNSNGWLPGNYSISNDILTQHMDAVGYNIRLGYSNNYSFVCGGYDQGHGTNDFSDIPHYMGFLKCLYTAGMVGANAGYYSLPTNGFAASFPATNPPSWLLQMMALSQVHALFWQFDDCLYHGTLLSGPQPNSMATDQPAYEFTNSAADTAIRVLARQFPYPSTNQFLITAWAITGPDRTATVTIPSLGSISVLARACGSVYQATTTDLKLVDQNGLSPTALIAPPANLHVVPGN